MRRSKRTGDARTAEEVQQARKQASLEANNTQSGAKRPGQLPPVGGGARTRARAEPAAVDDEELVSDDTEYIEPGPRVPGESNTYRLTREYEAHHAQIDSAAAQLQLFCAEVHPVEVRAAALLVRLPAAAPLRQGSTAQSARQQLSDSHTRSTGRRRRKDAEHTGAR